MTCSKPGMGMHSSTFPLTFVKACQNGGGHRANATAEEEEEEAGRTWAGQIWEYNTRRIHLGVNPAMSVQRLSSLRRRYLFDPFFMSSGTTYLASKLVMSSTNHTSRSLSIKRPWCLNPLFDSRTQGVASVWVRSASPMRARSLASRLYTFWLHVVFVLEQIISSVTGLLVKIWCILHSRKSTRLWDVLEETIFSKIIRLGSVITICYCVCLINQLIYE